MRKRNSTLMLFFLLVSGAPVLAQPADSPPTTDGKAIAELIEKLGSSRFQERAAAQKQLEAVGAPALDLLKKAIRADDLEVSKRAAELVRKIEEREFNAAMLAPKRVRLKIEDGTVSQAVAELAKASGYTVQLAGFAKPLDKKITLDTGDVTFWEALDKLCTRAGLIEQTHTSRNGQPTLGSPLPVIPDPKVQAGQAAQALREALLREQAAVLQQVQAQILRAQMGSSTVSTANPVLRTITLVPGSPKNELLSYTGAVRTRLYALAKDKSPDYHLMLEASAEPRLQDFAIVGVPAIEKATDENGDPVAINREAMVEKGPKDQTLMTAVGVATIDGAFVDSSRRHVILHFKPGEQPSKMLAELRGSFTAQVRTPPEALVTIEKVLESAGKTANGKSGEILQLHDIRAQGPGEYRAHLTTTLQSPNVAERVVIVKGAGGQQKIQVQVVGAAALNYGADFIRLLDANGNKYQTMQTSTRRRIVNGVQTSELTLTFRSQAECGEPDRLVLTGTRLVHIQVPFEFHNVPLE